MQIDAAALLLLLAAAATATAKGPILTAAHELLSRSQCRCLPGDACWPSSATWNKLNATVGGRLVATVPIGSPCHDPTYDEAACTALQNEWTSTSTHFTSSSSVMQAYFANDSCDPFTPVSKPCLLGNYVSYAVNVSSASDVAAAVTFANQNNVRLVVRNTGHDYLGRSTGAGGLAVWMHYLDDMQVTNYSSKAYSGPALKVDAGVLGTDAVALADAHGLQVITGECPSVGIAGAYTQGGGHSALSTPYGLAADQALEYQVVTAAGTVVTASATTNSDLYWALSGGGGGTFGVVTSLTVRAHPAAGMVGGAALQTAEEYTTPDKWDEFITGFHSLLPAMVDLGASISWILEPGVLIIEPVTVANSTGDHVRDVVLAPVTDLLASLSIPAAVNYSTLSYGDHYATYMGPLPDGHIPVETEQYGSRLIPRTVLEHNATGLGVVLQTLALAGVTTVGTAANFSAPHGAAPNAVLPAWRGALVEMQLAAPWVNDAWAVDLVTQQAMTDVYVPLLEAVAPDSGVYMNEADFRQPGWQKEFYGANYAALLAVKARWDPHSLFWALKTVGSEAWTVDGHGRMCRAS